MPVQLIKADVGRVHTSEASRLIMSDEFLALQRLMSGCMYVCMYVTGGKFHMAE